MDAIGFKGLANWIPEASAITSLFDTDFCTGHGTKKFNLGTQTSSNGWHDMNKQAILPTWQWAFSENNTLTADWDFNDAASNGNSIKITGNLPANHPVDLMLYKTKLNINDGVFSFSIIYKTADVNDTKMKLLVVFTDDVTQKYEFPISGGFGLGNNWTYGEVVLPFEFSSREIAIIGFRFNSTTAVADYAMNLGGMNIGNVVLGLTDHIKNNSFIKVSYPVENNKNIVLTINWPDAEQLNYTLYNIQGKEIHSNTINLNGKTNYALDTNGFESGTYIAKFTDHNNHRETRKIIIK